MSYRTFVDAAGDEWQAFDVVPRDDDERRRNYDRRVSGEVEIEPEHRETDRRLTVGGSGLIRGAQGWLCFERGNERRRLSPIPSDWQRATDAELEAYCLTARPVRRDSASFAQLTDRGH